MIESEPATAGLSLRIDWLEIVSHAQHLEVCMYAGAVKQDARLLSREVLRTLVDRPCRRLRLNMA